ncbi:MAG: DNA topoisomerase IB [Chitinophagaceae bacterium]|nr:DNA topoisomerase IB [Chitinophagaceae bacterium]
MIEEEIIKLTKKKVESILRDPEKSAKAVHLVYVTDTQPGIVRVKAGKSFTYLKGEERVKDEEAMQRIRSLVIPPAWENVWICTLQNGHLQATGIDAKKRKQYRYHPLWNTLRNHTKFYRLQEFGKALPGIRLQLEKDLALSGLPLQKVLATVVSLLERTNIRVGSNSYEKLYGSFGLSTLKDKHVKIEGTSIKFSFKGKKGVHHDIDLKSKRLASIVKKCRDIPGQELFQYYDDNGERHSIDSGMVNEYIKKLSGGDFTTKDFRTWAGTVQAIMAFMELGMFDTKTEAKKKIVEALDKVSSRLGNTRTVCKKYYVHPIVISLYETNALDKYTSQLEKLEADDNVSGLTAEEKMLMKILESN